MDWKTYHCDEFDLSYTKEYLEKISSRAELDPFASQDPAPSFSYTALPYTGPAQSRVITALYRAGDTRTIALGVFHTWRHLASVQLYQQAMDEERTQSRRRNAFAALTSAFLPPKSTQETPFGWVGFDSPTIAEDTIRQDEHGLLADALFPDMFFNLLTSYYLVNKRDLPTSIPLYIGIARGSFIGSFAIASRVAAALQKLVLPSAAIVATGDPTHYGNTYTPSKHITRMPTDIDELERMFEEEITEIFELSLIAKDYVEGFQRCNKVLNNDQYYLLLITVDFLSQNIGYRPLTLKLSDYFKILKESEPCVVASALAGRPFL